MSELHILVVFDTETNTFRVGSLNEAPVDSDESVWDRDTEEWRPPTFAEEGWAIEAEQILTLILAKEDLS